MFLNFMYLCACILDMPRGKVLSEAEKNKITAYKDCGLSVREISRRINRSHNAVLNFLRLGEQYGKIAKHDHNKKLSSRQKRLILFEARKNKLFSGQIASKLDLPVTSRRVRQILNEDPHMIFKKRAKKPPLSSTHKAARLNFARNHMGWTKEWHQVLFSDEKKFNLDGPDGFQFYWHDKRCNEEIRMSRNFGGGSVMVWAGFSANGKTELAWVPTKMNSEKYIELLEAVMVEKAEDLCGQDFIFQQDNAAIHVSKKVKEWLVQTNITTIDWPARSPDLNPIENLWGVLARHVYANGRQYDTVMQLKSAIKEAWQSISITECVKLIDSMPKRIFAVISQQGSSTKY